MLFRKKIERSCLYCKYSTKLDEDRLLCAKKGIVMADGECRRFRYDPFKRVPSKYDADEFYL